MMLVFYGLHVLFLPSVRMTGLLQGNFERSVEQFPPQMLANGLAERLYRYQAVCADANFIGNVVSGFIQTLLL